MATVIGSDRTPYRWFVKYVGTWSSRERLVRVARIVWRGGPAGSCPGQPGGGYTAKLSIGLCPALLSFNREYPGWILTLCGVRLHYDRSYGGWHT
jgi:hypothetical protein